MLRAAHVWLIRWNLFMAWKSFNIWAIKSCYEINILIFNKFSMIFADKYLYNQKNYIYVNSCIRWTQKFWNICINIPASFLCILTLCESSQVYGCKISYSAHSVVGWYFYTKSMIKMLGIQNFEYFIKVHLCRQS